MAYSAECKLLEPDSSTSASNAINARSLYLKKVGSALFYGIASFLITVVNKTVLTSWKFPSFLALSIGQMVAGIVILVSDFERGVYCKLLMVVVGSVDFSRKSICFSSEILGDGQAIWCHHICGLFNGHTKKIVSIAIDVLWKYDVWPGRHTSPTAANVHSHSSIFHSDDHDARI